MSRQRQPFQGPETDAAALSQPDVVGQLNVGNELQVKGNEPYPLVVLLPRLLHRCQGKGNLLLGMIVDALEER